MGLTVFLIPYQMEVSLKFVNYQIIWLYVIVILYGVIVFVNDSYALISEQGSVIVLNASSENLGTVTAALLGANNPMPHLTVRAGFDTVSHRFDPRFYPMIKKLGLRSLRFPGGNVSGSYHWENVLGPHSDRPPGFDGSSGMYESDYYTFGFMEFMKFLETIDGEDPVICINFGTGSSEEASAWVEFANGKAGIDLNGDGIDHALLRIELGHAEPFDIRFWEIGNELGEPYKHMFSWHFGQLPNGVIDYSRTVKNYIFGGEQWQFRDLVQPEQGQRLVRENDWSIKACQSDGSPDQVFYIKYPPVKVDSFRLSVCMNSEWGEEWQMVDDLNPFNSNNRVFTLDRITGQITFGDGIHGQIPADGKYIRAIYKSVLKDGLIDFYEEMKNVDPSINIGVPFHDSAFYEFISKASFDELPFDFIVDHPYKGGQALPLETEHWRIHATAYHNNAIMNTHRENLDNYFKGQKDIGIVVSEYNLVYGSDAGARTSTNPWYQGKQLDFFGRSLDNGLYVAGALMSFFRTAKDVRLLALDIHHVVPLLDRSIAGWPCTSLIGPIPFLYLNPSGYVYSLFSQCFRHQIFETQSENIPLYKVILEDQENRGGPVDTVQVPCMETLGTMTTTGDTVILFVLNRTSALPETNEIYDDIKATVRFYNFIGLNKIQFYELNGENIFSINNSSRPEAVSVTLVKEEVFTDSFQYIFPAHSLTMIKAFQNNTGVIEPMYQGNSLDVCQLVQNFPNPFNSSTKIRFYLLHRQKVLLKIFNYMGQEVITLINEVLRAGYHHVLWDGTNAQNQSVTSGIYFYQVSADGFSQTRKILFMK
jgi:alpha-L-arabinofuranosidase